MAETLPVANWGGPWLFIRGSLGGVTAIDTGARKLGWNPVLQPLSVGKSFQTSEPHFPDLQGNPLNFHLTVFL